MELFSYRERLQQQNGDIGKRDGVKTTCIWPHLVQGHVYSSLSPPSPPVSLPPQNVITGCPASQVKKTIVRPDCSSAPTQRPCVSDLLLLKGESWLRAETLDDSTPQRRISELRVWSYEPFIVFAPSSSGYTSGQNLEVLYIIRNIIWNIIK